MTQVKMPEPLRLRWNKYTGRYDISEDHRAAGDADLITTTQAEAYAYARVRVALEEAESIVRNNADACSTLAVKVMLHSNADAIRALIPPLPGPVEPTT